MQLYGLKIQLKKHRIRENHPYNSLRENEVGVLVELKFSVMHLTIKEPTI